MPREQLHFLRSERKTSESVVPTGVDSEPVITADAWDEFLPLVQVHWQPEDHVQFSVQVDKAALRRAVEENDDDSSTVGFFTETLSRQELNNAIKVLRRARNQAFGADE